MNYSAITHALMNEYLKAMKLVATLKAQNDYLKWRLADTREKLEIMESMYESAAVGD